MQLSVEKSVQKTMASQRDAAFGRLAEKIIHSAKIPRNEKDAILSELSKAMSQSQLPP